VEKEKAIEIFDPNGPGIKGNLFGFPFTPDNAELIIVPVPWEVTVSYHTGTAQGPDAVVQASSQLDCFQSEIPDAWKLGISMLPVPKAIHEESTKLRTLAAQHIARVETGETFRQDDPLLIKLNESCENLNVYVKSTTTKLLKEGKLVGLLGGDHSTPLGFIRALADRYNNIGILHIDAHADLRKAYEGFQYSHGSIMYNALKIPEVSRLVQVGIRDFCEDENEIMKRSKGRVVMFTDDAMKSHQFNGASWNQLCDQIIAQLPPNVYISIDIDGLDPKLCPNTGTPVAGGLEFSEATYLLKKVALAGKRIIGFDLVEIAPGETDWDANVGARLLYQLCNWMAVSQGRLTSTFQKSQSQKLK